MPKCFFVDCRAEATFQVQRLWRIPNKAPFGLLYCCAEHRPGTGPRYTENNNAAAQLRQRLEGRSFYDVRPINVPEVDDK